MPGFDHLPSPPAEHDNQLTAARNSRYGLVLFTLYSLFYAGYMLISAFRPTLMDIVPFAGMNLATLYGLGLIAGALFLALVYGWLCRAPVPPHPDPPPPGGRGQSSPSPLVGEGRGEGEREDRA